MTTFLSTLGLPEIIAGILMIVLNAYVLTGGADFGGGVWDLLARGPRRDEQRHLIADAIGPIWEANHVWLIIVVVMLFTAFPPAFSTLSIILNIPLTAMLVGIVLRGCGVVFRHYGTTAAAERWSRTFAIASTITPLLLGICVGAIATGAVGKAAALLPVSGEHGGATPSFDAVFIAPWLAPFPMLVGILALALFAFLAAVYLTVAAPNAVLRYDFRRRAYGAAIVVFAAAMCGLLLARTEAPDMHLELTGAARWAMGLQLAIAVSGLFALGALWREKWGAARFAAAMQASLILWGWALSQYPYLVPFTITIHEAAPLITLRLLLWALAAGALILIPSLVYLFRTFSAARAEHAASS